MYACTCIVTTYSKLVPPVVVTTIRMEVKTQFLTFELSPLYKTDMHI